MKKDSGSIHTDNYDPMKYWNSREHPNTAENPGTSEVHTNYITKQICGISELLEIGPGVGRLFSLYSHLDAVHTVDISKLYSTRLRNAARMHNINLTDHYLDEQSGKFPFLDDRFPTGIASYVYLHVPFETIRHTMSEMARVCSKVIIISGLNKNWPQTEAQRKPSSHCFNHDYKKICDEIGCEVKEFTSLGHSFGLVYGRK